MIRARGCQRRGGRWAKKPKWRIDINKLSGLAAISDAFQQTSHCFGMKQKYNIVETSIPCCTYEWTQWICYRKERVIYSIWYSIFLITQCKVDIIIEWINLKKLDDKICIFCLECEISTRRHQGVSSISDSKPAFDQLRWCYLHFRLKIIFQLNCLDEIGKSVGNSLSVDGRFSEWFTEWLEIAKIILILFSW